MTDQKRLFFQLLHKARELWNWSYDNRHLYLEGMRDGMLLNKDLKPTIFVYSKDKHAYIPVTNGQVV